MTILQQQWQENMIIQRMVISYHPNKQTENTATYDKEDKIS